MNFTVLSIFPAMFDAFWDHGIIRRAVAGTKISHRTIDIRAFATDKHRTTDDRPYGGGCGMVMKPEPLAAAIRKAKTDCPQATTLLLSPQGRVFNQRMALNLASRESLILVCGRYEGVDERISHELIDEEVSIGDYILTGGELAAMIVIEAVTRLLPGVLGGSESAAKDSFSRDLLEHAHYTRPCDFEGDRVPEVLISGNHQAIERWRLETALIRTFLKRPDLLAKRQLNSTEIEILNEWRRAIGRLIDASIAPGTDPLSGSQ